MCDGERLPGQAEYDLLVGDEAGQADAVHRDVPLFPASRPGERLLLDLLVGEGLVTPARGEPFGRRQRSA